MRVPFEVKVARVRIFFPLSRFFIIRESFVMVYIGEKRRSRDKGMIDRGEAGVVRALSEGFGLL